MAEAAPKAQSRVEFFECEQGSEEWHQARLGIPTASRFGDVMAEGDGRTRSRYMRELAGEIITGQPAETYSNRHMERGKAMEDEARERYVEITGAKLRRVGFVRNAGLMRSAVVGASPDSLIGFGGGLEIKTMLPELLIQLLERPAAMPPAFRAQVHGNMMVTERETWDLMVYWPRMPTFRVQVRRDEVYIKQIKDAVERFDWELQQMVGRLRKMGA